VRTTKPSLIHRRRAGGVRITQRRLEPYYYIVAGVLLQGLSPVLTKLLLHDGLSRETVVAARYLLAVLVLLPFGFPTSDSRTPAGPPRPRDWVALLLVGVLGSGVGALLFTAALEYSSAGVVNAISKTAPIFVAFLGVLTLRERVTRNRLLLVGAMVGTDLMIGLGDAFGGVDVRARLVGDGLALLAGLTRATAEILAKGALRRFRPATVTLWRFLGGVALTGSIALASGQWRDLLHLQLRGALILGLLGIVCTALSMFLYYRGTAHIPVHVAVSLRILGAIATVVVSWIVLDETLNLYHVAGMGLLISGAYLLVIRTAREEPQEPLAREPRRLRPQAPSAGRMRVRLTLLIATFIIATVVLATGLSVRHTNQVVQEQIRLTMGKVAAVLVQLPGLEDPPGRQTLQQYLSRVVRHRIQDQSYSVDIIYIAMRDGQDNLLAFAVNEDITLVDSRGQPYSASDPAAARRLLDMAEAGGLSSDRDIIPVRAELRRPESPDAPAVVVEIGCKRSIVNRVLAENVARSSALVIVLVSLGVLLAARAVRRFTRPIERIAAALQRLSGGELDLPLYSEGHGEVRQMGDALQSVRDSLRAVPALQRALALQAAAQAATGHILRPSDSVAEHDAPRIALLLLGLPPRQSPAGGEELLAWAEDAVAAILRAEGEVDRSLPGWLVCHWPADGEEDALWAVVAAQQVRDDLAEPDVMLLELAHVGRGHLGPDHERVAQVLERLGVSADDLPGSTLCVGETVHRELGHFLELEAVEGKPLWVLLGLREEPAEEGLQDLSEG
jgi:drug/metabolite transporter (DMT)-like permease/HAMP domain-containing protein